MSVDTQIANIAAVVIGRNEGERLRACLQAITAQLTRVTYVDSGSSDDSLAIAEDYQVIRVELDAAQPFTAARARNAGYQRMTNSADTIRYVQFIDGDCEINPDWLEYAAQFLDQHDDVAIVCGRRRERYPAKSIYNRLCDLEWDTQPGAAISCGGDALVRVSAFSAIEGFRDDLVAGEEPELCLRLRQAGWAIFRLDHEMTIHDANMMHFSQWWQRSLRSGFTYAQGVRELGRDCARQRNRVLLWGGILPLLSVGLACWQLEALLLLIAYPLQVLRIACKSKYRFPLALQYATFLTIGKFPQMLGIAKYYLNATFGVTNRLIEYK